MDTHIHTYTCTYTCTEKHIYIYIYMYIHVIMNRHGHNNIRNGIVWVQTGHSTCTCTVSLHAIEPRTHQKFESSEQTNFRSDKNRI